jgi:hypothetical protein
MTGAAIVGSAVIGGEVVAECSATLDFVVAGSKTATVEAPGYASRDVMLDGGGDLKDCGLWPGREITITIHLDADSAAPDGGTATCDGG